MGKIKEIIKGSVNDGDGEEDIDKVMRELEKEEMRRAKLARLKEYRLEAERRARELERELKSFMGVTDGVKTSSSDISPSDIEIARLISNLPEEERSKMIAIVSLLKSAGKSDSSAVALLPVLMSMYNRSGSTEIRSTEQVQQKIDLGALITGIATLIQATKDDKDKEIMSQIINIALSKLTEPQQVQTKSSLEEFFDNIDKLEKLATLFAGRSDPEYLKIMKELKEMEMKHNLALKKLELDTKLQSAKLQEEKERKEKIVDGLKKVISSVAEAAAEGIGGLEGVGEVMGRSPDQTGNVLSVVCDKCGKQIVVPPDAKEVVCPSCGTVYKRSGEQGCTNC
jgi:ribosomal protein S27E